MDGASAQGARRRHSGDYGDDEQRGAGAPDALGRYGFGCYRPLVLHPGRRACSVSAGALTRRDARERAYRDVLAASPADMLHARLPG